VLNATQLKKGKVIKIDDDLHVVLDVTHITPGNWRGYVQVVARNLSTGNKTNKRFRSTDKIEDAFIEKRELEYTYQEGELYVFMDTETWAEYRFSTDVVGDAMPYLKHNQRVKVDFHQETPVGIDLPTTVDLEVVETQPGSRGDTVTNVQKPAKLETGLEVSVPLFIEEGEQVRIDTRTGQFVERVK
jgi:elongation factor P